MDSRWTWGQSVTTALIGRLQLTDQNGSKVGKKLAYKNLSTQDIECSILVLKIPRLGRSRLWRKKSSIICTYEIVVVLSFLINE